MLARDQLGNCRALSGSSLARLSRESPQKKTSRSPSQNWIGIMLKLLVFHLPRAHFQNSPPRPRRGALFHWTMHKQRSWKCSQRFSIVCKKVFYLYMPMLPPWEGVRHGESFHIIKNHYFDNSAVLHFSKIDTSPRRGA